MRSNEKIIIDLIKNNKITPSSKFYLIKSLKILPQFRRKNIFQDIYDDANSKWPVRYSAIDLLDNCKGNDIVKKLMDIVKNDKSWMVRLKSTRIIEKKMKNTTKLYRIDEEELSSIYENETFSEVRKNIINLFKYSSDDLDSMFSKIDDSYEHMEIKLNEYKLSHIKLIKSKTDSSLGVLNNKKMKFSKSKKQSNAIEELNNQFYKAFLAMQEFLSWFRLLVENNDNRKNEYIYNLSTQYKEILVDESKAKAHSHLSSLREMLMTSIIWHLGENKFEENKKIIKNISEDKKYSSIIRRVARWQIGEKLFLAKDKILNSQYLNKKTNLVPINSDLCDDVIDYSLSEKLLNQYEDYNIIDSNIRNKIDDTELSLKLKAVKELWGKNIIEYSIVGGSTSALKIVSRNDNKKQNYYLKNIGDSYQSAKFVAGIVNWLDKTTNIPIVPLIINLNNCYVVKLGKFYYTLEEEIIQENNVSSMDLKDEHFYRFGELASLLHLTAKNFHPKGYKQERPLSDHLQYQEIFFMYEYIMDISSGDYDVSLNSTHKNCVLDRYNLFELKAFDPNNASIYYRIMLNSFNLLEEQFNLLTKTFSWEDYHNMPKKVIHFDLAWNNIGWNNKNEIINLFDWNKAGWMPCVEEMKNSVMNHSLGRVFDPVAICNYLSGYFDNSALSKEELFNLPHVLRATYLAAFHDHLNIILQKNTHQDYLLTRRLIFNSMMLEVLDNQMKHFNDILKLNFEDRCKITQDRSGINDKVVVIKDALIEHLLNLIKKDNKKIRVDIIHTLRQICPHSQNDKIRIELESILIDKSISKETIEAVSDALSVIGDTNTINILLKKISKMDFTISAAPYLNSLKFLFSKLLDGESVGETQNLSKKAIRIALDRCKNTSNQEEILRSAQLLNVICNYN